MFFLESPKIWQKQFREHHSSVVPKIICFYLKNNKIHVKSTQPIAIYVPCICPCSNKRLKGNESFLLIRLSRKEERRKSSLNSEQTFPCCFRCHIRFRHAFTTLLDPQSKVQDSLVIHGRYIPAKHRK